uniref:Uncharacterized protein n=1 Tax=Pundamilia nyererei TaxID=303518 RepID=A0A3B4H3R3_9CICH
FLHFHCALLAHITLISSFKVSQIREKMWLLVSHVSLFVCLRPQVSALPGSVFNLAPPHMFGNRLNPNSTMAALIAQSEASPAGNAPPGAGRSSRGREKVRFSPIGGLQIRGETLPPVATSIEQLLERQWNEGQSFLLQQGAQGDGERTQAPSILKTTRLPKRIVRFQTIAHQ